MSETDLPEVVADRRLIERGRALEQYVKAETDELRDLYSQGGMSRVVGDLCDEAIWRMLATLEKELQEHGR